MKAKYLLATMLAGAGILWLGLGVPAQADGADDDVIGAEVVRPPAAIGTGQPAAKTPTTQPDGPARHVLVPAVAAATDDAARRMLAGERNLARVRWERAKAAVADSEERARKQLLKPRQELTVDDFAEARRRLADAKHVLDSNEDVAVPAEHKAWNKRIADLRAYVDKKEEEWSIWKVAQEKRIADERQKRVAIRMKQQREKQVGNLMNQALSAHQEGNYEAVIRLLKEVLKIDPQDRQAKWMLVDAENSNVIYSQRKVDDRKDLWTRESLVNVREAMTPFDKPMNYPDADIWKELIERRKGFQAGTPPESPANQRVRGLMDKTVPEIRFNQIGFENALNFLRDLQRVNINPNWGAMEQLGITKATEVTLQLREVTFETALRELLAKAAGREDLLDYMIRDGVIKISTKDDLSALKYILVYDVRDLLHPLTDFRVPSVTRDIGDSGTDDDSGDDDDGLFGDDDDSGDDTGQEAAQQSRQEKVDLFLVLLRTSVLPDTWAPTGDANVLEVDGLLVVKQTANGHRELAKLLGQLREHSRMQITIEARFLTIESAFLEDIGFDLDFIFNVNQSQSSKWSAIPIDIGAFGHGGADRTTGQFVDTSGSSTLIRPVGEADILGSISRSSLVVAGSFLDDLQVDFFLRATQAHQHSTRLNSLRVTLLNGHEAYIIVETQEDYVSDLTPSVAEAATAFDPDVDQLIRGVSFGVRATVTADRKYVIMTVYPTLRADTLAGQFTFQAGATTDDTGDTGDTGDVVTPAPLRPQYQLHPAGWNPSNVPGSVGGATRGRFFPQVIDFPIGTAGAQNATIQLRNAAIQEVRTTVMVPDQGTLLLGGQRVADELEVETGVPILSKIPIVKRAFTSRNFVKRERTLLILIRPEILIPEELEPAR